jgi:hypothetical protein
MQDPGKATLERRRFAHALFLLLLGPMVWALYFSFAYGLHSLACAAGGASWRNMVSALLLIGAAVSLAALGVSAVVIARRRSKTAERAFESYASAVLLLLSAVAILWTGAAPLFLKTCEMMR